MKGFISFFFFMVLFFPVFLFAQQVNKHTISGEIKDAVTGEDLIGASVYIKDTRIIGTTANSYGFYSLQLPDGKYTLYAQFIGYQLWSKEIELYSNMRLNISLEPQSKELKTVEIKAEADNKNVTSTQISVTKIDIKEIESIPVIFGERDVLKTIQMLPGIKSAGEGNSGFYVRGGGADQNLILLDEANVYNPSHLLGFFSVFNSDAIKDVTVYKGGMPSEYGGRLSSVLDIKMKEGNNKFLTINGGIGLISSRLTIEGPLMKEKSSFIFSARRTYADLFLLLSKDTNIRKTSLFFYDMNLKANVWLNEKNRLYVSGYFGRDAFGRGDLGFNWGNATATLRWNHIFNNRLFLNSSFIYSNYDYHFNLGSGDSEFTILSGIEDFNLKEDFQFFINPSNSLKFGINSIYHVFIPGKIEVSGVSSFNDLELDKKMALENAAYVSHEVSLFPFLNINYGLRYSLYRMLGNGTYYSFDEEGTISDSVIIKNLNKVVDYDGPEPRIAASIILSEQSSIKASFTRNIQYLHLLSNTGASTPIDLWIPSSNNVKPQSANQYSLGYFRNFNNNKWESSIEVYYKTMENQIDYRNGADILLNKFVESQLAFGNGKAYGIELFLKKKFGKLSGWVSYTLSRTERLFDRINKDRTYPAKQDRTHDFSIVLIYSPNERFTFSASWVYYTGNAVTFPSGKYEYDGRNVNYYTERNGYRMPDYHRMDIAATWNFKKRGRFESNLNFSIYNVYSRLNAYSITFRESKTTSGKTEAVKFSLFPIVPSVTYNFKF